MSTHAIIEIFDELNHKLVSIYCHHDGYIKYGVGEDIASFLAKVTLVSGFISIEKIGFVCNGMGDLAAQIICFLKGNTEYLEDIYLTNSEKEFTDYLYQIFEKTIIVKTNSNILFEGTWKEYFEFVKNL